MHLDPCSSNPRSSGHPLSAHCFTCSKDLKPLLHISRALARRGIAVFRLDFTGLGESEGDFAETTFSSNVGDLVAAAKYMEGHLAAPTIGAPCDPQHVAHLFEGSLDEIEERGEATVTLAGRRFTVSRDFVRDLPEQQMAESIGALDRFLMIFHSPVDETVAIENAARIYQSARDPKSFVSLDTADHLLLREVDSLYVGSVLAAWAERYIDGATDP